MHSMQWPIKEVEVMRHITQNHLCMIEYVLVKYRSHCHLLSISIIIYFS